MRGLDKWGSLGVAGIGWFLVHSAPVGIGQVHKIQDPWNVLVEEDKLILTLFWAICILRDMIMGGQQIYETAANRKGVLKRQKEQVDSDVGDQIL